MQKRSPFRIQFTLVVLGICSGCTTCSRDDLSACPLPAVCQPGGLVFVADGAGDFRATSKALRQAVRAEKQPLTVETFVWSHGYLRVLADQLDQAHARDQGLRLADRVRVCRQAYPDLPIYLLGHSAGCAVVLAAAEVLPPQSLDHIVLLAPSVPADYDLRPALRSVKHELDVFCSLRDDWYLRMGFWLLTVTHGRYALPAGNAGFRPRLESAEDARLYQKLCHYPWGPWLAWTGHEGGHFGYQQQGYLRGFVVPLLAVY